MRNLIIWVEDVFKAEQYIIFFYSTSHNGCKYEPPFSLAMAVSQVTIRGI